jgi:hypothetical protein
VRRKIFRVSELLMESAALAVDTGGKWERERSHIVPEAKGFSGCLNRWISAGSRYGRIGVVGREGGDGG